MFKKLSLGVIGLAFVLAPLAVSAQSADVQAQLASLLAQLAQLQLQLGQAQSQAQVTQTTVVTGGAVACPNPALTRSLSQGSTGTDVAALQGFLINTGYLSGTNVTGFFGPLTLAALQRFQSAQGIISYGTPDTTGYGYVGPKTRYAIVQVCTTPTQINTQITPPPPPPVQQTQSPATFTTFTAIPSTIAAGQQSTLTWNVQNASGCVLNQQVPGLASVTVNVNLPVSGTAIVAPSTSIVYTIVCTAIGIQNLGAIQSIGVTVTGSTNTGTTGTTGTSVPSLSISVNPSVITVGSSATLSWNAVRVTSCGIQSSPSVFSSNTLSGSQSGVFNTVGTTTYTFTCENSSGQHYASTTSIVVNPIPSSLVVSPATGTVPLAVTFSGSAGTSYTGGLTIQYGDGSSVVVCATGSACSVFTTYHTYTTPGTYTVTLNSADNTRLGIATVTASAVGPSLVSDRTSYTLGDTITVTWNNPGTTYPIDWVTYAPQGTEWSNDTFPSGWPKFVTDGAHSWTKVLATPAAGTFELLYYTQPADGGSVLMRSAPFTVKTPYFGLTADKTNYTGGSNIHISWKNPYTPAAKDWLTMVPSGAHYASSTWPTGVFTKMYTGGTATGIKDFQVPTIPGQYDLVYYSNDTFTELMRSTSTVMVSN